MSPPKKKLSELSASAKYYRKNPKAKKKKDALSKAVNARPEQKKKRREAGAARRKAKKNGAKLKDKDYDHATDSFVSSKKNRGRANEGGRRKKAKGSC